MNPSLMLQIILRWLITTQWKISNYLVKIYEAKSSRDPTNLWREPDPSWSPRCCKSFCGWKNLWPGELWTRYSLTRVGSDRDGIVKHSMLWSQYVHGRFSWIPRYFLISFCHKKQHFNWISLFFRENIIKMITLTRLIRVALERFERFDDLRSKIYIE
jgi:hypothetical protein